MAEAPTGKEEDFEAYLASLPDPGIWKVQPCLPLPHLLVQLSLIVAISLTIYIYIYIPLVASHSWPWLAASLGWSWCDAVFATYACYASRMARAVSHTLARLQRPCWQADTPPSMLCITFTVSFVEVVLLPSL